MKTMNPKTDGVMEDYQPEDEDEMGIRFVEHEGKKYTLKARNPHGFFKIHPDKGRIPDELSGEYTTQFLAENAIKQYHSKKNDELKNA